MSNEPNPYAPPEPGPNAPLASSKHHRSSATRFGVVGNKLHCDREAILPEICIATGAEADLIRLTKTMKAGSRIARWIPCFLLPGLPSFSGPLIIVVTSVLVIRHFYLNQTSHSVRITYSITRAASKRNRLFGIVAAAFIPITLIISWIDGERSLEDQLLSISGILVVALAVVADYFFSNRLTVVLMGIRHRCVLKGFSPSFLMAAQEWQERQQLSS